MVQGGGAHGSSPALGRLILYFQEPLVQPSGAEGMRLSLGDGIKNDRRGRGQSLWRQAAGLGTDRLCAGRGHPSGPCGGSGCWRRMGCHSESPRTGWLKQQTCTLSQLWRLGGQNQGVGEASLSPEAPGEDPSCLSQLWGLLALPGFWQHLSIFTWSFPLSLCPLLFSQGHQPSDLGWALV